MSTTRWLYILTGFGAVAQLAIGWPVLAAVHHAPVVAALLVALLLAAALPVALTRPRPGILLGTVGALLSAVVVVPSAGPWPWPVTTLLWFIALVLLVAATAEWRKGLLAVLAGAGVSVLVLLGAALFGVGPVSGSGPLVGNVFLCLSLTAAALALGSALGQLTRSRRDLVRERGLTAEEEGKRRELQQRNQIAEELHDVVAHSLSVISVQATTATYRLPGMDESTADEFTAIAGSSRRALTEMRGLLAVLRGDDAALTAPQPSITDIPDLVAANRASGPGWTWRSTRSYCPCAVPPGPTPARTPLGVGRAWLATGPPSCPRPPG